MSRTEIVTATDNPLLIETEPDALFQHWRKMTMLTLQGEPVDLHKLDFCVRRLCYWSNYLDGNK